MHGLERGMVDIACIIVGQWRQLAVVRVGRAMEDLSKRFAKVFGKEKDVPVGPPVEDEKIAFGKKTLGQKFQGSLGRYRMGAVDGHVHQSREHVRAATPVD